MRQSVTVVQSSAIRTQGPRQLFGLLAIPALALLGLLGLAVSSMIVVSLIGGLGHYERFLTDPTYLAYVWRSLRIAFYTTVATLTLGYPVAYVMSRCPAPLQRFITLILVLQFFSVNVTRIYSLILIIGINGVINRALLAAGLIHQPLHLIYNEFGVTVGLVSAALPFAVFPISTVLGRIPYTLQEAARTLGADRTHIFWQITFPLSLPGVMASATVVFLYSLGAFATPLLLGGGFVDLISNFSYEQAINLSNYGFAAAGAVVTVTFAFVGILIANLLGERWIRV